MSYDKDTDYSVKIEEAAKKGDYKAAAEYEKARNAKIDGEKLNYEKTNNYSGWLDSTDYGTIINKQIESGASKKSVADTLKKRQQKASGTEGLKQYAYDDIYDKAISYIMQKDNFSYKEKTPVYKDSYSDDIQKLYKELINADKFSYNPYEDELYSYYLNAYRREGNRAMEEVLGSLSASTGGVASSYATTAASQAYDYYNSKAADIIPELYSKAYKEYLDGINTKIKGIELGEDLAQSEYERYLKALDRYDSERDFSYKLFDDARDDDYRLSVLGRDIYNSERDFMRDAYEANREYARENYEDDRDYRLSLEELYREDYENDRKWQNQEWENNFKAKQTEIENALKRWSQLGYLDEESATVLGLPVGLPTSDYRYKEAQRYKIYNK